MNKDEYIEAWTEDDPQKVDPVVEAVKAARRVEADDFADAYKNDRYTKEERKKKSSSNEEEPDSI